MHDYQELSKKISEFLLRSEYQSRKGEVRKAALQLRNINMSAISKFERNPKLIVESKQDPQELLSFARLLSKVFPFTFSFDASEYSEKEDVQTKQKNSLTERFEFAQLKAPKQYAITLSVEKISQLCQNGRLVPDVWFEKDGKHYGCEDLAAFMPFHTKRCEEISLAIRGGSYYYDSLSFVLLSDESNVFYDDAERVLMWDGTLIVPDGYHRVRACNKAMMMASEEEKKKIRNHCFSATVYYLTNEELRDLIYQFNSGTDGNLSLRKSAGNRFEFDICTYLRDPANGLDEALAKNITASKNTMRVLQPQDIIKVFSDIYPDKQHEKMVDNCRWLIEFLNAFAEIFSDDVKDISVSVKKKVLFRRITTVWLIVFSKEMRDKINAGACEDWKSVLKSMLDIPWGLRDNMISQEIYSLHAITSTTYNQSKDFFHKRWNEVMADVQ